MVGFLLAEKQATLTELRTIYDYEDALDMLEAALVPKLNEYLAHREAQDKSR